MKIHEKMKVREVAGENIVLMQGPRGTDMSRVVALNSTALLLYQRLLGRDFEMDDAVRVLLDEYEVDEPAARKDVENWVAEMKKNGLIIE